MKKTKIIYDIKNEKPVIRFSICTGEKVAGFKNIHNGMFREVLLIQNPKDKSSFMQACGVDDLIEEF